MVTVFAAGLALAASSSVALAHDCTCRFAGQSYRQGEIACIRDKLAQCAMYLNNSSWSFVEESCPQVNSLQQRMTAVPSKTARR